MAASATQTSGPNSVPTNSQAKLSRPAGLPMPLRKPMPESVATFATRVLVRSVSMTRFTLVGCHDLPHASIQRPGNAGRRKKFALH
jgi:hypothetical protein